jgi:hypothetical protein
LRIQALSLRRSLLEIVDGADWAAGGHVGQKTLIPRSWACAMSLR